MLGIDPATIISGYGIIIKQDGKSKLIDYGYLKLKSKDPLSKRVGQFYKFFKDKIEKYNVTDIATETPFLGKNASTFMKLGYIRGIIYLLTDERKLNLHEFSPSKVKSSVTGYGNASKEQVANMMHKFFPGIKIEKDDTTDALAVALCGLIIRPV